MSDGGDYGSERDPASQGGRFTTRTRLPESEGPRAPAPRPGRSLITVVGVVVLLLAAIAFANRGGGGGGSDDDGDGGGGGDDKSQAQPTAPTGEKPVNREDGKIPSGFSKSEQGAESAATNFAVALGGDGMFKPDSRHEIIDSVYTKDAASRLKAPQDKAYSTAFLRKLGLDKDGDAPKGKTFVSRTVPIGSKVKKFDDDQATVSVWYTGLLGLAGPGSTNPVQTSWHTWTFKLQWTDDGWKVVSDDQKDGPAPVPGDSTASGAKEISEAVQEYGGFSYAR